MSRELRDCLFAEISSWTLVDPHTHINPLAPAAGNLADILGYHYYTELAHSAGMPRSLIEEPGLDPREKVRRLVAHLGPIENTIQYAWLIELAQKFFGFRDERLTSSNWESLYEAVQSAAQQPDRPGQVLAQSQLTSVFLTNDFDDALSGFDPQVYIPCLRTDDLVFKLDQPSVRERLERRTGVALTGAASLRAAIGKLFEFFVARGARACAISLPADFAPRPVDAGAAEAAVQQILLGKEATVAEQILRTVLSGGFTSQSQHKQNLAYFVFWTLAEFCADYRLPFDLMIGVQRGVYAEGVFQGQDLYDSRVSLIQYRELFNGFPRVTFPISVLASVTNQELVSYSWIFPNVVMHGHWWYSNTPAYIEHDLAARLEAAPQNKLIGYYSDMYKLEFAWPKFRMFMWVLAKVLAEQFVIDRGWNETRALDLARRALIDNVQRVFFGRES